MSLIFCDRPFLHTHVLADGEVICHCLPELYFNEDGTRTMSMGNLQNVNSFSDIWYGEKYQELRKTFQKQESRYKEFCQSCPLHYNINIENNSFNNVSQLLETVNINENFRSPRYVQLELTTKCVYNCSVCHRVIAPEKTLPRGDMSKEIFEKFLSGMTSDTKIIITFGQGESLANKNYFYFCERIKEKLLEVQLRACTNMWYVNTEEKLKRFLNCGLSVIEIAFFATNEAEFFEYYKIKGFDRVLKNIEMLCNLRDQMENPPLLIWKYILFKWNDSEKSLNFLYNKSRELNIPVEIATTITPEDGYSRKYIQDSEPYKKLIKRFNAIELRSYVQNTNSKKYINQNKKVI